MPTRREFLKLSAIAALGAAAGCAKPDGNPTARPTDAEPTKAIPPTQKIDVTNTPNVPATNEAIRLNAERGKEADYPQNYSELKAEKMLSESEFLGQMKGYPNVGKEYAQVKALLSAGLSKEKVNLSDIAFEVSSFSWDNDKYSWIVIARNSKTGEVYVPRDAKTHTRNIDMSVYGYLKEYQAGGALPFTMEPLKLPEFSGPEYKIGFARSKKGWLVAFLDGGPQKAWYDFRDKEVARWKDKENRPLVLVDGVLMEESRQDGREYTQKEVKMLEAYMILIGEAVSTGGIYAPTGEGGTNIHGTCEKIVKPSITVGLRECYKKDGSVEEIPVAWNRSDGIYIVPSGEKIFVATRSSEKGVRLVFDDISEMPEGTNRIVNLINTGARSYRVVFPHEERAVFAYRKQVKVVPLRDYRMMMLVKYLNPRPPQIELIGWADIPDGIDTSTQAIDAWIKNLLVKDEGGIYKNISFETGLTSSMIDEKKIAECLGYLKDERIPPWMISYVLKNQIKLKVVKTWSIGQTSTTGFSGSQIAVGLQVLSTFTGDVSSSKELATLLAHEQLHSLQPGYSTRVAMDVEFQAYYLQELMTHYMGFVHPLSYQNRVYLQNGTYKRSI